MLIKYLESVSLSLEKKPILEKVCKCVEVYQNERNLSSPLEQPFSICGTRTTGGTRAPSSGTRSMNDFLKQFFEVEATVSDIWGIDNSSTTRYKWTRLVDRQTRVCINTHKVFWSKCIHFLCGATNACRGHKANEMYQIPVWRVPCRVQARQNSKS